MNVLAGKADATLVAGVRMAEPIATCELVCPDCGAKHIETMPADACIRIYECRGCGSVLRPRAGDCCVFCSHGSRPCPPVQIERAGGSGESCRGS
ncbi:MAG TPA: GDCCVxC domain-containing (seleno)protein [Rhizomicrobium sp.]|nr:GDCCVxC domain-containing (seleno)protein [Rhizomicrobium sp.]